MRPAVRALALVLLLPMPAFAFEPAVETAIAALKPGGLIPAETLGLVLREGERWCYWEQDGACQWADDYGMVVAGEGSVTTDSAWDAETNIAYTDTFALVGDRLCFDPITDLSSLEVTDTTGRPVSSEDYDFVHSEMARYDKINAGIEYCFDYLFSSADSETETLVMVQRTFANDEHDNTLDTDVTVHFDAASAEALGLYF